MEWIEQSFLVLAYVAVIGFLINGLDDLWFDSQFLVYLLRQRSRRPVSLRELKGAPEQWIAVFVPAWQERGIVDRMAQYAAEILDYEKYDFFVGVYPNDPDTIACVDEVCARFPRVHKVVVPHPGPTNKADCLNWIYRAMRLNEVPGRREYRLIALHDAEDILHPLLLKVYNFFVPGVYDMGQVPVFALEHPVWRGWTANTYIDDFSELHTKDLFVRESIGGVVPSAGVGTCFTRESIDRLAMENRGDPFHTGNLTEDYEVGIRLKRAGLRTGVINVPVERMVSRRRRDGSFARPRTVLETVAVREAFPKTFWSAVRQRTRWILGISFQTWEQAGWRGSLPMRYTLMRDRRAPLTHLLNMAGYLTLAFVGFQWVFGRTPWAEQFFIRPILQADSFLWHIVIIDTWLLAYRAAQKFISVLRVYSVKQAAFSIPRVVVGNFINFVATVRAVWIFAASKLFRRPIVWHKTTHAFPKREELREYTRSIEDLLLEEKLATREQILQALETRQGRSAPACLLRLGLLDEEQYTGLWSRYAGLPVVVPDPERIAEELLRAVPESLAVECEALPLEGSADKVVVAFLEPPGPAQLRPLRRQFGRPIESVLARPSSLAFARDHAYPRLVLPPPLGNGWMQRLRHAAGLQPADLEVVRLNEQTTRRNLAEILVDRGRLPEDQAERLWADRLRLAPALLQVPALDRTALYQLGPLFCWLHRLVPVQDGVLLTSAWPHPALLFNLRDRLQREFELRAVLPARLEGIARELEAWPNPDRAVLDGLVVSGSLTPQDRDAWLARQSVISDPAHHGLLLEKRVTAEQVYQVFQEIAQLPPAADWNADEARFLSRALPPGWAARHGCFCLDYKDGLRIGLAQMPSVEGMRRLRDRFVTYPIYFQALSFEDGRALRRLIRP